MLDINPDEEPVAPFIWICEPKIHRNTHTDSRKHPSAARVKTSEFGLAEILEAFLLAATSNFQGKWDQSCCSVTRYSIE